LIRYRLKPPAAAREKVKLAIITMGVRLNKCAAVTYNIASFGTACLQQIGEIQQAQTHPQEELSQSVQPRLFQLKFLFGHWKL
jgi:hypothetical protein